MKKSPNQGSSNVQQGAVTTITSPTTQDLWRVLQALFGEENGRLHL